jgi:L-aminopeptidase/D-esterase-like protein
VPAALDPQEQAVRFPHVPVPVVFDFRDNDLKAASR